MALKKKQKRKNHLKHPKRHHFATSFVKWIFRYWNHSKISSGNLASTVRVISIFNLFHIWHLFMFWKKTLCSSDYQNSYYYNKCIAAKNAMYNHEQNPVPRSNSQQQHEPWVMGKVTSNSQTIKKHSSWYSSTVTSYKLLPLLQKSSSSDVFLVKREHF